MNRPAKKRLLKPIDKYAFKKDVRAWAGRIGVQPRDLHVRTMTQKCASCSTAGRITFSSSLLVEPADFREHVIVHELLHLQVPTMANSSNPCRLASCRIGNGPHSDTSAMVPMVWR
jgi:predicted metal-dependent hydrolase